MNTTQIDKGLSKHVKYFQDVYPIDLLPSTLIKPSIIVVNLDKHYTPGSHLVAVCISDSVYAEYYDSYGLPLYKLEISIPATPLNILDIQPPQTTGTHLECLRSLLLHLRLSQSRGTIDDFIREYVCICSLHLQRKKGSALDPLSSSIVPRLRPVGAAEVVQISDINEGKFSHDYQSAMSLLVIFTFLEGRDREPVVMELSVVESHSNRFSSCLYEALYLGRSTSA